MCAKDPFNVHNWLLWAISTRMRKLLSRLSILVSCKVPSLYQLCAIRHIYCAGTPSSDSEFRCPTMMEVDLQNQLLIPTNTHFISAEHKHREILKILEATKLLQPLACQRQGSTICSITLCDQSSRKPAPGAPDEVYVSCYASCKVTFRVNTPLVSLVMVALFWPALKNAAAGLERTGIVTRSQKRTARDRN
jgi:hypothetical protein